MFPHPLKLDMSVTTLYISEMSEVEAECLLYSFAWY